jgi:rod shape-determining protein MreC
MRNIAALLVRFAPFFLFVFLQVVALSLYFTYSNYHKIGFVNATGELAGWLYDVRTSITEPFELKQVNRQLTEENASLMAMLPHSYRRKADGTVLIDSVSVEQEFVYIPAKVIDISLNKTRNVSTIDRGTNDGIEKEMGVISPQGIVGFVYDASPNYAVIVPVQSDLFSTSVKLGGANDFGVIKWEGGDPDVAKVYGVSASRTIEEGDRILTKGASARYPEGIPVGTIKSYKLDPGRSDYTIDVLLQTDFKSLYHVYVIKALKKDELKELLENVNNRN